MQHYGKKKLRYNPVPSETQPAHAPVHGECQTQRDVTTTDHTTPTQMDARKINASATGGMDTEDNAKLWKQTHEEQREWRG